MLHPIQYNFILGDRPKEGMPPIVVSEELIDNKLLSLGLYPQTLEHLAFGYRYSQSMMNVGERSGYLVTFVYADSIENSLILPVLPEDQVLSVYFICTNDSFCLDRIASALHKKHNKGYIYVIDSYHRAWFNWENTFENSQEVIEYVKGILYEYLPLPPKSILYSVPDTVNMLDNGLTFNPSIVNTLTGHSMLGDWNFPITFHSDVEKRKDAEEACKQKDSFIRQNILINQIEKLDSVESGLLRICDKSINYLEQAKAPLIMVLPFTNSDLRKFYKGNRDVGDEKIQKAILYVLSQPTDHNYTFYYQQQVDDGIDPVYLSAAYQMIYFRRSRLLDIIGQLHASFKFSPYLRLPFLGSEINRELSFVAPKISMNLCNAKDQDGVEKVMMQLGAKIAENALSPEAQKMFIGNHRQIVAITDLPVEWIPIDGVPLGFSHDVCRMPELPMEVNLMNYVVNEARKESITRDILKHTLVVYGTREATFEPFQKQCDAAALDLGFSTQTCTSKEQFFHCVQMMKPQLLVIDTHGNYDEAVHQTYIYMGKEKVYPQDLVDHKISVPLVFLSACNTAPVYNSVNTLANGFIQCGGIAVTSSYLPLGVTDSSIVYLRLLRQLDYAATHVVHKNWLSFVSHILRTSYIHAAFRDYYEESVLLGNAKNRTEEPSKYLVRSMNFDDRRQLYAELQDGVTIDSSKVKVSHKIPHYLLYSTIGRADLVTFQVYMDKIAEDALRKF